MHREIRVKGTGNLKFKDDGLRIRRSRGAWATFALVMQQSPDLWEAKPRPEKIDLSGRGSPIGNWTICSVLLLLFHLQQNYWANILLFATFQ
jgi:hypothetical protein